MEVLFHFVFQLVKIAILSTFYLGILLLITRIPSLSKKSYCKNLKSKTDTKLFTWVVLSLILFIWQFTYWGDHGLGDYSRIPIGKWQAIEQIDYDNMFIRPDGHEFETLGIKNYSLDKGYCFGLMSEEGEYFIWNLSTNGIQKFDNHIEYYKVILSKDLDNSIVFHSFEEAYRSHWGGWRFWLLP